MRSAIDRSARPCIGSVGLSVACWVLLVSGCAAGSGQGGKPLLDTGVSDSAPTETGGGGETGADSDGEDSSVDDTAGKDTSGDNDTWTSELGGYVQVSVAEYHRCALDADRAVTCWGSPLFGKTTVPEGTYTTISVGRAGSCALDEVGVARCWGCEDDGAEYGFQVDAGQCNPPTVPLRSIVSADLFGVGLSAGDGSLVHWSLQTEEGSLGTSASSVGTGLVGLDAYSAGICVVNANASATCWSNADYPAIPADILGPYGEVRAGGGNVCARNPDSTWDCWAPEGAEDEVLDDEAYASADVGPHSACGVRAGDGSLACFGSITSAPTPPGSFSDVSVAELSACAVRDDGYVVCWGDLDHVEEAGSGD